MGNRLAGIPPSVSSDCPFCFGYYFPLVTVYQLKSCKYLENKAPFLCSPFITLHLWKGKAKDLPKTGGSVVSLGYTPRSPQHRGKARAVPFWNSGESAQILTLTNREKLLSSHRHSLGGIKQLQFHPSVHNFSGASDPCQF